MTFGAPGYLSALFLAVPIIALHMVRSRRRRVVVSSTLIWRLTSAQAPSARAFRKLLPNMLLALQLLALTAMALALAKPEWGRVAPGALPAVVVVDVSGSMAAVEKGISRIRRGADLARDSAEFPGSGAYTVVRAAGEPEVIARGVERKRALKAMGTLRPWYGTTNLGEAIGAGEAILKSAGGHGKGKLLVVTDDPSLRLGDSTAYDGYVLHVAPKSGNVAVVSLEARQDPSAKGSLRWVGGIANPSPTKAVATATLTIDGTTVYSRRFEVPAYGRVSLPGSESNLLRPRTDGIPQRASLGITVESGQDSLKADNARNLVIAGARDTRISIIRATSATATGPMAAALGTIPGIRLSMHNKGFTPPPGTTDLTIYDGFSPDSWPEGKAIILGTLPSFLADRNQGGKAVATEAISWDSSHSLLRFVDLQGAGFSGVVPHSPLVGGRVVVEGSTGPILEEMDSDLGTTLVMPISLINSDFIQRIAFPIFVANLVQWAGETQGPLGRWPLNVGDLVDLRGKAAHAALASLGLAPATPGDAGNADQGSSPIWLEPPTGGKTSPSLLWRVDEPGFHNLHSASSTFPIAVNPLTDGESDTLNPKADASSDKQAGATGYDGTAPGRTPGDERATSESWAFFASFALLVVLCEWYLYVSGRLGRGWLIGSMKNRQRGPNRAR